jgi:putative effector of murein hydrolase
MMDYFQLASGILVISISVVPFYISARIFKVKRSFFFISVLLGIALVAHGVYRLSASFGDSLAGSELEFFSALLIFSAALSYTYLRYRSDYHV